MPLSSFPSSLSVLTLSILAFHAIITYSSGLKRQLSTAHILLYTATADFRHDSIPTAIQSLLNQSVSAGGSFDVLFDPTEDRTRFTDEGLEGYDAIMFVSTTGEGAACFRLILISFLGSPNQPFTNHHFPSSR